MERDFRYLRDKYGDAGARDVFEKICTQLFHAIHGENAHNIKVNRGDDGIDILVGDFSQPIINYQCKYFLDGIGDSQKQQIKNSFSRAIENDKYKMKKWALCLPCNLDAKAFEWWSEWKSTQESRYSIDISLLDGCYLISELKTCEIYEKAFDDDIRNKLDTILVHFQDEKKRITEEIIVLARDINPATYDNMIFVKKLEMANVGLIDSCKSDFFNAELVEYMIKSKGDSEKIRILRNLKAKILTFWETQYRIYQDETDGNMLLTKTYERIEDSDTTTLSCDALPEVSLMAKKGMLHQWAEECSIGWLKNYKQKLEEMLTEEINENEN